METPGAVEGVGRVIGYGRVRAELEHGAICPIYPTLTWATYEGGSGRSAGSGVAPYALRGRAPTVRARSSEERSSGVPGRLTAHPL